LPLGVVVDVMRLGYLEMAARYTRKVKFEDGLRVVNELGKA